MPELVRDVTTKSFAADVIERSRTVPVVVDFWAPWCGPCRTLGPLLEREVNALGGRVELVKVNTDENPELANEYQTLSIPAVKAFRGGEIVDEFVGAVPVPTIRQFLARLAPSPSAEAMSRARAALTNDGADAIELLRPLVDDPEVGSEAAFRLAHRLAESGRLDEARAALAKVAPTSELAPRVEPTEQLLDFLALATPALAATETELTAAASAGDLDARQRLAALAASRGAWTEALDALLESVARKPRYADGAARKAMLALFDHLEEPGRDAELAREYRRKLQIVT
jgi:putative thioredoxin